MREPLRPRLHSSVFAKLLAVMLATLASLLVMVAVAFWFIVAPSFSTSRRLIAEYTRVLAATGPDLATAKRLAGQFEIQVRYEGPDGAWQTAPGLPSIRQVQGRSGRHDIFLAPGPRGGTYLVAWQLGREMRRAHSRILWMLHVFVVVVVFTAYVVLRRLLRPIRSLHEGVVRLGEGQLDVAVPSRSRDEFGVLAAAFNQMVRRIADMLRSRDQLLLDVSHELRSPLTRVKVALALLPDGEKNGRIAAGIASDVAEMEAMVTELLELERLRDVRGLRSERQDLVALIRQAAEPFAGRPPGVVLALPGAGIPLDLDRERMRMVLRNLLENAFKYALPDSGPVTVSLAESDAAVTVRVADDGPGIPEEDLPQVFEPFFRVDRSRSKRSGGYGLGLSICKRVLEAHGGRITVANRPGRGAAFEIVLPKPQPSPGPH